MAQRAQVVMWTLCCVHITANLEQVWRNYRFYKRHYDGGRF